MAVDQWEDLESRRLKKDADTKLKIDLGSFAVNKEEFIRQQTAYNTRGGSIRDPVRLDSYKYGYFNRTLLNRTL